LPGYECLGTKETIQLQLILNHCPITNIINMHAQVYNTNQKDWLA